jgi:hypothetical protein
MKEAPCRSKEEAVNLPPGNHSFQDWCTRIIASTSLEDLKLSFGIQHPADFHVRGLPESAPNPIVHEFEIFPLSKQVLDGVLPLPA